MRPHPIDVPITWIEDHWVRLASGRFVTRHRVIDLARSDSIENSSVHDVLSRCDLIYVFTVLGSSLESSRALDMHTAPSPTASR